jgi:hypothetical protein
MANSNNEICFGRPPLIIINISNPTPTDAKIDKKYKSKLESNSNQLLFCKFTEFLIFLINHDLLSVITEKA